eukprot:TRINITY_DN1794_c0_g1_i1.p1 TRINITY_DN1794_c0_g1~~TRINITY_DN1794_c0_g1_i1.p1  ORF type:complete len:326 (-),score=71.59 TRINITY_DN1794_c0_g1_i1:149-1126(-)
METPENQFDEEAEKNERRNLIVNYIPASLSEEALKNVFLPFGALESCKLMVDKLTGQSLGYGFVKYTTVDAAERAIGAMNGRTIENKTLKVSVARPSSPSIQHANLYVSQLDKHVTKIVLDQLFGTYGRIIDSKILIDPKSGESRGVGFVRFDTRGEAENAIKALNGALIVGSPTPIHVKVFADGTDDKVRRRNMMTNNGVFRHQSQVRYDPFQRFGYEGGIYGSTDVNVGVYNPTGFIQNQQTGFCLFVYNLPQETDDNFLWRMFGPYGALTSVKVVRDTNTNKCKGFGFVNFVKYEDAQQAIIGLNGYQVGNKYLKVSFKTNK